MKEDDIYQKLAFIFEHAPKLKQSQSEILVRDHYESAYKIRPPGLDESGHPLLDIEMMAAEDPGWSSVLREQMEGFAERELGRIFNLSFVEYLRLPTYMADMLMDVGRHKLKVESNDHNSADAQLRALMSGGKKH